MSVPITKHTAGPLAAVALAGVMAVNAVSSFDGFDRLGPALLGVVGLLVGLALLKTGVGRLAGGRMVAMKGHVHGHGAGLQTRIAKHEAGHVAGARGVGGKVRSATVGSNGGLVQARLPMKRREDVVTFLLAGQYALGSSEGAGADNAAIRKELRRFPVSERKQVRRDGERAARRIVSQRSSEIRRDAARLAANGRL